MNFLEKWYWANYIKGTNPITSFVGGLVSGFWIPVVLSAIFCFLIDPQWRHIQGMAQWNPFAYVHFYILFWREVFYAFGKCANENATYFWSHTGEIAKFVRQVLWLDGPHSN